MWRRSLRTTQELSLILKIDDFKEIVGEHYNTRMEYISKYIIR
jgi:hypothetical protein